MIYGVSALTEALDVLLQVALLLLAVDAGQVHAVEPAVLLRLVPVGLQITQSILKFWSVTP